MMKTKKMPTFISGGILAMKAVTMTLIPLTLLMDLKGLSRRIALIAPTLAPIPNNPKTLVKWLRCVIGKDFLPGDNNNEVQLVPGVIDIGIGPEEEPLCHDLEYEL